MYPTTPEAHIRSKVSMKSPSRRSCSKLTSLSMDRTSTPNDNNAADKGRWEPQHMSRKILVDRLDSTCVIKRLEDSVGGMVAGMDETFCETGRCSEFGGEM